MRHYHVLEGLRGCYMPDDNSTCETLEEAREVAGRAAEQARDNGEAVTGSAQDGFYAVGEYHSIEISSCEMADCLTEGNE